MYEKQDVEALERQFNAAMEEADTGSSLEAIQRLYGEFDSGDAEAIGAILHPEFQAQVKALFLEGKSYKGVRGFLNWRSDMEELFEQERFLPVVTELLASASASGALRADIPPYDLLRAIGDLVSPDDQGYTQRMIALLVNGLRHGTGDVLPPAADGERG